MNRYQKVISQHKAVWETLDEITKLQRIGVTHRISDPCEMDDELKTRFKALVDTVLAEFNLSTPDPVGIQLAKDGKFVLHIYNEEILKAHPDVLVVASLFKTFLNFSTFNMKFGILRQDFQPVVNALDKMMDHHAQT